jgi:hypothetical protein
MATRKKPIQRYVRERVWNLYIGEDKKEGKCLCCNDTTIDKKNFMCGHVKSEKDGGIADVENLRPICSSCNGTMGSTNMRKFMKTMNYKETDKFDIWKKDLQKHKIQQLNVQPSPIQLKSFYEQYLVNGNIELNPSYQRSFCWNFNKQICFIDSIMSNLPIYGFMICKKGDSYECIDGQNRLHTVINFIQHIKINDKYLYYLDDNNMKCYYQLKEEPNENEREFNEDEKKIFDNFTLSVSFINEEISEETKQKIFCRLQMGEPPNDAVLIKNNDNEIIKLSIKLMEINISNKLIISSYDNYIFTLINIIKIFDSNNDKESSEINVMDNKYIFKNIDKLKLEKTEYVNIYNSVKEFLEYIQSQPEKINEKFLIILSKILGLYGLSTVKAICKRIIDTKSMNSFNNPKKYEDINKAYLSISKIGITNSDEEKNDGDEENEHEKSNDELPKKFKKITNEEINYANSKITKCIINKIQFDGLKYATILKKVYDMIDDYDKIKEHTSFNMCKGKKVICGYKYYEPLKMSFQNKDSNGTMNEIINQCRNNKINLELLVIKGTIKYKININDGNLIIKKIEISK